MLVSSWYLNTWHLRVCLIPRICGLPSYCCKAILGVVIAGFKLLICNLLWLVSVSNCVSAVRTCRVILPQLKILSKCPVKLGQFFMTLEEDLLNYSLYFKNLPQQTMLMQEGGIEFFAVSWQWPTLYLPTYVLVVVVWVKLRIGWWFWEKLFFLIQKGFVIYTQEIVLHFIPVSIVFCRFAIEFCLPNLYFRLSRKPLVTGSSWIRTSSNLSRESLSTRFFLRRWASTQLGQIPKESSRNITTSWRYVCIIDCMTN